MTACWPVRNHRRERGSAWGMQCAVSSSMPQSVILNGPVARIARLCTAFQERPRWANPRMLHDLSSKVPRSKTILN